MLRVLKRCRLLVSLLLLCGCFLSFSSVSFAATVSITPSPTYRNYESVPILNTSGSSIGRVGLTITSLATDKISQIHYPDNTDFYSAEYLSTFQGELTLSNLSEDYIYLSDFIEITDLEYEVQHSTGTVSGVDCSYKRFTSSYPDLIFGDVTIESIILSPGSNTGRFGAFVIPPESMVSLPFSYEVSFTIKSGTTVDNEPANVACLLKSFSLNSSAVSFRAYILPDSSIPATDSAIRDVIVSGNEGTQSAIDEQTQQQQQQYDDFTDDGSSEGESFITDTDSTVKEKIGIFTFLDTLLENLLGLFAAPEGDAVITFPAFSMEVGGESHQIWADTQFNLSSLDDDFSVLLTAVRFGTVATVYFALINFLGDTYSRIFGGKSE